MERQDSGQVKVAVGIESFWGALVNDLSTLIPSILPEHVSEAQTIKGNGGLGTIYLMKFNSNVPHMSYQKEEVVELDETAHRIGIQVIEGGHLAFGFKFYKNTMQLTAMGDSETQVDLTVSYVPESDDTEMPPGEIVKTGVAFIKALESLLIKKQGESK